MRITSSVQRGRRAGRRRLRARRHAPGHVAARLLVVAVKWTSRWHPLNADDLAVPAKFASLAPFPSHMSTPQLCRDPTNCLRPFSQALTPCSPQPNRSSPIPAETPPWTPHRGQTCSEPLYRRRLLRRSRGEPLMLMRFSVRVLLARSGRRLYGRGSRPPCPWPWGLG